MNRRDVEIATADGVFDAGLHTPDGSGPWPAVIMYPDAGGRRDTMHAMAQRLADLGYAVLVPNFYYRLGDYEPFDLATAFSDADERQRIFAMIQSVTTENITADTAAMLEFLAAAPEVADGKVGTTGYCMGGRISFAMAGRFPDRVGAAASFHGGGLATDAPDSPHLLAAAITAKVYVAGAENDGSFDEAQFSRLSQALTEAGVDHTLVTYPALHGFAVPDLPVYDEPAAERHWEAMEELFGSVLQSGQE
ncbi:MAG TPA: dienelactone hydrolase family protein [Ilumatobacter sp.]|nr:dienelactone hydrolase family protein [Ilumatobacter sp.]